MSTAAQEVCLARDAVKAIHRIAAPAILRFPVFALQVFRHAKIRFSAFLVCGAGRRMVL
jgi:hypothetical protein